MNNKIKLLFYLLGGVVLLTIIVFSWRHYAYQEDSSVKNTAESGYDQSLSNYAEKIDNSSENKETNIRSEQSFEEQKVSSESSQNNSNSDSDPDELSDENSKKFESEDEDEEETDDDVTVEVESDDE